MQLKTPAQLLAAGGVRRFYTVPGESFLEIIDGGGLGEFDQWSNSFVAHEGGGSAQEIRTWVAAFAALESAGAYETIGRYYKPAPELIAGFAIRTALLK